MLLLFFFILYSISSKLLFFASFWKRRQKRGDKLKSDTLKKILALPVWHLNPTFYYYQSPPQFLSLYTRTYTRKYARTHTHTHTNTHTHIFTHTCTERERNSHNVQTNRKNVNGQTSHGNFCQVNNLLSPNCFQVIWTEIKLIGQKQVSEGLDKVYLTKYNLIWLFS